ncbi:MAG: Flp1 family type IVb pilin [Clostridia bacterium]
MKEKRNIIRKRLRMNRRGMEMIQVAILIAIAVTLGLIFKTQITDFVEDTFGSLSNAKF